MSSEQRFPGATVVFIVTSGDYSDYGIDGVYSTRELAEAAIKHDEYEARIEEFFLDNGSTDPNRYRVFTIHMQRDGSVSASLEGGCSAPTIASEDWSRHNVCEKPFRDAWTTPPGAFSFCVTARDLQHAIKIVNEKRAQLIANNEWPA